MSICFNPTAPRGQQWTVTQDGKAIAGVSRCDAAAALRSQGLSINEANVQLTQAKLQASRT